MQLFAKLNKGLYRAGETLTFIGSINNNTSMKDESLESCGTEFQLQQLFQFSAQGHKTSGSYTVMSENLSFKDFHGRQEEYCFQLPQNITSTMSTPLMCVSYQAALLQSTRCCLDNPCITLHPITIAKSPHAPALVIDYNTQGTEDGNDDGFAPPPSYAESIAYQPNQAMQRTASGTLVPPDFRQTTEIVKQAPPPPPPSWTSIDGAPPPPPAPVYNPAPPPLPPPPSAAPSAPPPSVRVV